MLVNKYIKIISLLALILFINACSSKPVFIDAKVHLKYKPEIYKKRINIDEFVKERRIRYLNNYKDFEKKNKDLKFKGYFVDYLIVKPYFKTGSAGGKGIERAGEPFGSYPKTNTKKYNFYLYTLSKEPARHKKYNKKYFNEISKLFTNKKTFKEHTSCPRFEGFHDENTQESLDLKFSYRVYGDKPSIKRCFIKKLDDETFLISTFVYLNTKEDIKIFDKQIIPRVLKSIKLEETMISPWEFYSW